jgi:hypothetical protein
VSHSGKLVTALRALVLQLFRKQLHIQPEARSKGFSSVVFNFLQKKNGVEATGEILWGQGIFECFLRTNELSICLIVGGEVNFSVEFIFIVNYRISWSNKRQS